MHAPPYGAYVLQVLYVGGESPAWTFFSIERLWGGRRDVGPQQASHGHYVR